MLLSFGFLGCQKTSFNGNLDGEWEVMEVIPVPPKLDQDNRFFMSFYLRVCQLTVFGYPFTEGKMDYDGKTMTLEFPYIETEYEKLLLAQYGISTNPVTFSVSFEGNNRMTLTSEETVVHLRKF